MLRKTLQQLNRAILCLVACTVFTSSQVVAQPSDYFQGASRKLAQREVARLTEIQSRWEKAILNRPGVFGMGIGLNERGGQLVFKVLVELESVLPDLPRELEGVPVFIERSPRSEPLHGGAGCVP